MRGYGFGSPLPIGFPAACWALCRASVRMSAVCTIRAYDRKRLGLAQNGGGNRAGQRDTRHSTTSTSGSTGARAGWRIGGQSAGQTMQGMIL